MNKKLKAVIYELAEWAEMFWERPDGSQTGRPLGADKIKEFAQRLVEIVDSPANMCDTSSKLGDEIDALGRLKKRLEEHDHGSWNPVEIETMNTMVGGFLELVEDEIESLKRLSGKGITPDVEGLRKKTERALWKSYYDGPMETEHPIDLMDAIRVIGELFGDLPVAEPKGLTPEEVMDMYLEAAIEVREYERGDFKARFLDQSHAAIFKAKIKSRLSQTKEEDDSKN